MKTKRITIATVKSFIKKNIDNLMIDVRSTFNGCTDSVEQCSKGFNKAIKTEEHIDHTQGVEGAWFVGSSRDYFKPFETETMIGYEVTNSCGRFVIAVNK